MNEPDDPDMSFTLESLAESGPVWTAREFGPLWNGWLTPVVDKATLQDVLVHAEERHQWHGATVELSGWLAEPEVDTEDRIELNPRADGLYDLGGLGWTFISSPWRADARSDASGV